MAKFLNDNELNLEVGNIFVQAKHKIIIISPYISLHPRYAERLSAKKDNDKLQIVVVFGKNEDNVCKSMKKEDFYFFKQFPNIEIHYQKRLHAKYYANEDAAILTSMNLYGYSQDNNIEAGVMIKISTIGQIASKVWKEEDSIDKEATSYFEGVIKQAKVVFKNEPRYEDTLMGLTKRFIGTKQVVDELSVHFEDKQNQVLTAATYERKKDKPTGYCIRTGVKIPFSVDNPLSTEAFKEWNKFRNADYPEKFCHFSGEKSNGETSKKNPVLRKNWKKAKEIFNF